MLQRHLEVLYSALTADSLAGYGGGVYKWIYHCAKHNIPPEKVFLAVVGLFVDFRISLAGTLAVGSITKVVSGCKWWHVLFHFSLELPTSEYRIVKRGAKTLGPRPKPKHLPVTVDNLLLIYSKLNFEDPVNCYTDVAFWSRTLATFFRML